MYFAESELGGRVPRFFNLSLCGSVDYAGPSSHCQGSSVCYSELLDRFYGLGSSGIEGGWDSAGIEGGWEGSEGGRERGEEVRERERGEEVRDEGREDVRMRRIGLGDMEGVMYELPYAVKSINYSLSV